MILSHNKTYINLKIKCLEIQTVSYCNATCIVCPWTDIKSETRFELMPQPVWEKLVNEIKDIRPLRIMPYLNNEPLLDKALSDKVRELRNISPSLEIELATNGLLLNKEISTSLLKSNVTEIRFSLFGNDQETQSKMMGKQINYQKVQNNILEMAEIKKSLASTTNISVVKIINSPYFDNDSIQTDYWEQLGINVLKFDYVNRSENTGTDRQRDPTIRPNGCDFNRHKQHMYIDVKGDVLFCCHDWRKVYPIANIMQDDLVSIFNSEKYQRIRRMVDGIDDSGTDFLCRKCKSCLI